ncbi:MAG: FimV/HubP family polar landmark protein [Methylococcales bacterium]
MKINKLSRNLAIASLLTPVGVNALGIGEIQLRSALNQNFSAEIPLIASPGENTKGISVKLASPAAFEKAGVERSYLLSTLRFKPELNADGTMSVKVLSSDAIREPFLNFLVEVKWAEGRMLKEYIVLLDPPGSVDQAVVTAQTASQWQAGASSTSSNVTEEERLYGEQVDPEYNVGQQVTSTPATTNYSGFPDTVVVPKGAILWTIAEKMRAQTGGTQEQMLLALFRSNPDAFYKNNINALQAGATLNIPPQKIIESISRQEGIQQVAQHNQRWNQKSQTRTKQQTISQQTVSSVTDGQLTLAPSEGDNTGIEDQALLERLQSLLSQLELMTEENAELKVQVAELNEKVQKLSQQTTVDIDNPVKTIETATKTTQVATADTINKTIDEAVVVNDPKQQTSASKQPSANDKPAVAVSNKQVPVVKPSAESASDIMSSPWAIGSVIGAMSLGLIGWQMTRRRKLVLQEEMELNDLNASFDDKQQAEADNASVVIEGLDSEQTTAQDSELGDSIFFSEYRPTESIGDNKAMEVDHTDLDPLSEADVYVAYGRYQQAEELIQQALNDHPERDEYKLKLLEIHHAKDDSVGFTAYITQLKEEGTTTSADFWARAQELGAGFAPENLFGKGLSEVELNDVEEFSSELFGIDSENESLELNDDLSTILTDTSAVDAKAEGSDPDSTIQSINFGEVGETISQQLGSAFSPDELNSESLDLSLDDDGSNLSDNLTEFNTALETDQLDSELTELESVNGQDATELALDSEELDTISWNLDIESEEAEVQSDFPLDSVSSNSVLLENNETSLEMDTSLDMATNDSLGLFSSEDMVSDSFTINLNSKQGDTVLEEIDTLQLDQSESVDNNPSEEFQLVIDGNDDEKLFVENNETTIFSLDDISSELVESAQISDLLDEVTQHNTEFAEESVLSELFEPASLIQESELFESELSDLDEIADKLDLAKAYIDMDDGESARGILNEVIESGTEDQIEVARSMVQTLEKSA